MVRLFNQRQSHARPRIIGDDHLNAGLGGGDQFGQASGGFSDSDFHAGTIAERRRRGNVVDIAGGQGAL